MEISNQWWSIKFGGKPTGSQPRLLVEIFDMLELGIDRDFQQIRFVQ